MPYQTTQPGPLVVCLAETPLVAEQEQRVREVPGQHNVQRPEGFVLEAAVGSALGPERFELPAERRRVAGP